MLFFLVAGDDTCEEGIFLSSESPPKTELWLGVVFITWSSPLVFVGRKK